MQQGNNHRKNFSLDDIERYHSGNMSSKEMHELEKAALDDPFLADALEGYAHTQTPKEDVSILKQKLEERTDGKVIVLQRSKPAYKFLKIAVMAGLIAGFIWAIYKFAGINQSNIAKNNIESKSAEVSPTADSITSSTLPSPAKNDTATIISDKKIETATTTTDPISERKEIVHAEEKKTTQPIVDDIASQRSLELKYGEQERENITVDSQEKAVVLRNNAGATPEDSRLKNSAEEQARPSVTFRGNVVDANNNAIPYATIINNRDKTIRNTDERGNFTITAPDSTLEIAINSVGFESKKVFLDNDKANNEIVLKPSDANLSEVVVTGYGKKSKRKEPAERSRITLEEVEPAEGWSRFDDYVAENLKSPDELDIKSIRGEVKVSFDVNNRGDAVNIKVEKSLCGQCDEEALRIIKENQWKKKKKNKRVRASVRF